MTSDADGWADHRLVISKMRLRLRARRRPQLMRPPVPGTGDHTECTDGNTGSKAIENSPGRVATEENQRPHVYTTCLTPVDFLAH
nr:unnamed protein product [Spirometra erinaceieuropaei]